MNGSKVQLLLKTDDGKTMTLVAAPPSDYHTDSTNNDLANNLSTTKPKLGIKQNESLQDQKLSFAKLVRKNVHYAFISF